MPAPISATCHYDSPAEVFLTDEATAQLHLLEPVHQLMHVKHDMGAVGDEDPALGLQAMFLQRLELLEEARHVHDTATADDIDAVGVHQPARQDVEVVGDAVRDDGVARVVAALGAAADLRFVGEDVGQLALAFVAPLGAEHNRDGHDAVIAWEKCRLTVVRGRVCI